MSDDAVIQAKTSVDDTNLKASLSEPRGTNTEARPVFGASVLETLTVGMYNDPLDALRELIQNAYDSIRTAAGAGLLGSSFGQIEVELDEDAREILVKDNGIGIPRANVRATLTNVGLSDKVYGTDIGFRGIGRLHGIAYCDSLVFRTSSAGENIATEVVFNARGIRELIMPQERDRTDTAEDILYACTEVRTSSCAQDEHFFEARLSGISPEVQRLLHFDQVYSYLAQEAPVAFDTTVFFFGGSVMKWAKEHNVPIGTVPLVLKSGKKIREVFKPFKGSYKPLRDVKDETKEGDRIEIEGVSFYPEAGPSEKGYWIWYSTGRLLGQIGDKAAAGFRLRKQNMSVGGSARIDELISEPRFNKYFIGEVFIQSQGCIPNARRDGFEDTTEWTAIKSDLCSFLKDREKEVRTSSKLRSDKVGKSIRSAIVSAEKAETSAAAGVTSAQEREKLINQLEEHKAKLDEIAPTKIPEELQASYDQAVSDVTEAIKSVEAAEYVVAQTKGQLDRKQKKLLQDILETLQECLPSDMFSLARQAIMNRFESKEK